MGDSPRQGALFASDTDTRGDGVVAINGRCLVRSRDGRRIVFVGGIPITQFAQDDRAAELYAALTLVELGFADQKEVAAGFGVSTRTLRRAARSVEAGGVSALGRAEGYPRGRSRLEPTEAKTLEQLKLEGLSNRQTAQRLGVSEKAIRKRLRKLGMTSVEGSQSGLGFDRGADPNMSAAATKGADLNVSAATKGAGPHVSDAAKGADLNVSAAMKGADLNVSAAAKGADPNVSAAAKGADPNVSAAADDATPEVPSSNADPLPTSFDADPADRRMDRLFACLGLLDDAAPLFREGVRVPRAGVLLAVPALVGSGVFECASEIYGHIGPAFYGLRTTIVTLLLMALWRIKRAEHLKEHQPSELGRILGLDRAPEVKTVRRKLTRLAQAGGAAKLGRALAHRRVEQHGSAMGFLYLDGHVRAYHGQRRIARTHVARLHAAMPATTDYWLGDQRGDPVFVVTAEANAGLAKMLPSVLNEVRGLVGKRRVTIVFDRGGWSPKLFKEIVAAGFDLLTYRKGPVRRIPLKRFHKRTLDLNGRRIRYLLADQGVALLGGRLRLRQVTVLCDTGHQTPILTSRRDLRDIEVAFHMFERWRQENLFKYLREEYAIDALVDYREEPADAAREVPNPRWQAADHALRKARAEATQLAAEFGLDASANPERSRPSMRGFKIANAAKGRRLREALTRCRQIEAFRAGLPRRVTVQDALQGQPVIQLASERKLLTNIIKMVAYQAESDLVRLLAPHYHRIDDEGRTLVQTALSSAADIEVKDGELRITLAPLSSEHRSVAIAALCDGINRAAVCFPGTGLTMRFGVAPRQPR